MKKITLISMAILLGLFISILAVGATEKMENFLVVIDTYMGGEIKDYHLRVDVNDDVVNKLSKIRGVSQAKASGDDPRYSISVTKSRAFSWEEIHKEILWTMKKHYGGRNMIALEYDYKAKEGFEKKVTTLLYGKNFIAK